MAPDLDLLETVISDLTYLAEEWEPALEKNSLRRVSPVLRRLLIHGDYGRAWRSVGFEEQPSVMASSLDDLLGKLDRDHLVAAYAPLVGTFPFHKYPGALKIGVTRDISVGHNVTLIPGYQDGLGPVLVASPPNAVAAEPSEEASRIVQESLCLRRMDRGVTLSKYLDAPAAIVGKTPIPRRDVLTYAANKLGGAHYDTDRDRKSDARYALLDRHLLSFTPEGGKEVPLPWIEVLSIAQTVSRSTDAARLKRAYEKLASQLAAES